MERRGVVYVVLVQRNLRGVMGRGSAEVAYVAGASGLAACELCWYGNGAVRRCTLLMRWSWWCAHGDSTMGLAGHDVAAA